MNKDPKETIVISLGGSIIIPKEIQVKFLKRFREFILRFLKGGYLFIIVAGGGNICREYQKAAGAITRVSDEDKDWIGIHATRLNAHLLRTIFKKDAYPVVLDNPLKKIDGEKHQLFIASGWRPGWSTDYDAVLLAERFKAQKIINATNIDYVYPVRKRISNNGVYEKGIALDRARPIKDISWSKYCRLIGADWKPGMRAPVDPVAARLASKLKMTIIVTKGTNLKNLENILKDKKFKGTVIHP